MGRLSGKVALVTGTGGGIGRAAALLFASEGARVVGCDLKVDGAAETVKMVQDKGGEMISLQPVDLGDGDQVQRWIDFAVEAYGGFDILYNNAAAPRFGPISALTWEDWDFTVRNELDLIYWTCHLAWPHLVRRGGGVIVNAASSSALIASPAGMGDFAHSATKGGVLALTRTLAVEGAPHGIRAVSISPGVVATPAVLPLMDDPQVGPMVKKVIDLHLLKRAGTPEDLAYCALYLASDEAAWVTGSNFVIDGGWSCW